MANQLLQILNTELPARTSAFPGQSVNGVIRNIFVLCLLGLINITCVGEERKMLSVAKGVYSNMTYSEESGDLHGIEIFLVYSRNGYFVVFQSSEGEPGDPVLAKAKVTGNELEFIIPRNYGYGGEFKGTLSSDSLSGSFKGGMSFLLKRKPSYWQGKSKNIGK